ncbi:RrF2 family transcriptional regulator [Polymorphum gilvum]|uniref:Putative transcriptional regulator n=1 Tax=Polymorphum gilvum (strain LMG 25793 / CGMCC 1.9160 / SL003B-26A1) TaxID=991905 RepID=F2J4B6_POLGS|nr:Rrf2 family transcriptional regulator [Polymorphum gilvum]ADZ71058.1 Putative transcriptional regulator [Polymorphum gilvum SL003B-26A1]
MRLTMRTNLAMRTLMFCAVNSARTVRKAEIARACNASENHIAQVIHLLSQKGYLRTTRGRNGGIRLGMAMEEINVGTVFRSFEADVPFAECFQGVDNRCPLTAACRLRIAIVGAVGAFYAALDGLSLADLVAGNRELHRILTPPVLCDGPALEPA